MLHHPLPVLCKPLLCLCFSPTGFMYSSMFSDSKHSHPLSKTIPLTMAGYNCAGVCAMATFQGNSSEVCCVENCMFSLYIKFPA